MAYVRRALVVLFASVLLLGMTSGGTRLPQPPKLAVLQFDTPPLDDRRFTRVPLDADSVDRLTLGWKIDLPEIADGSPLLVPNVAFDDRPRDLVIVNTMLGRVIAVDAATGEIVWQTTPPPGPRWTTSSPAVDPPARFVF